LSCFDTSFSRMRADRKLFQLLPTGFSAHRAWNNPRVMFVLEIRRLPVYITHSHMRRPERYFRSLHFPKSRRVRAVDDGDRRFSAEKITCKKRIWKIATECGVRSFVPSDCHLRQSNAVQVCSSHKRSTDRSANRLGTRFSGRARWNVRSREWDVRFQQDA
jgi:hypothetical protein